MNYVKVPTLSIINLSNSKASVLTVDTDGNLCVFQGILENFHTVDSAGSAAVFNNNDTFFRPLYNDKEEDTFDLHNLADKVAPVWPSIYKASNLSDVIGDRIPTEAIIVCFDRSGSMDLVFEENQENDNNNDQQKRKPNTFTVEKNRFTLNLHLAGSESQKKMESKKIIK